MYGIWFIFIVIGSILVGISAGWLIGIGIFTVALGIAVYISDSVENLVRTMVTSHNSQISDSPRPMRVKKG